MAPRARFELATLRLTAECSTVELPGSRATEGEKFGGTSSFSLTKAHEGVNASYEFKKSPLTRVAAKILRREESHAAAQVAPKHCLPASGEDREDAGQRVEVARVNHLGGGMGIAQRPRQGDVHRAIFQKRGTIGAAAGHAVLDREAVGAGELDYAVHEVARRDAGAIHGANHEAFADFRIGEALALERGIRTDKRVHRENIIRRTTFFRDTLRVC